MVCPDYAKGDVLPGVPRGSIRADFQGSYFAPEPTEISKRAVLLLTDAFGLPLIKCKLVADELSRRLECDAISYDNVMFHFESLTLPDKAGIKLSVLDWIKLLFVVVSSIPSIISNRTSVVDKRLETFFALLKDKKNYEKIGTVGVIIAHPGAFTLEQVIAMKVPASWICAQGAYFQSRIDRFGFASDHFLISTSVYSMIYYKSHFIHYERINFVKYFSLTQTIPFSMSCPNCTKGDFLPGEPLGSINADFHNAYFSPGPGAETSKHTVLLLTDAFGMPLKNCKIMADELAKRLECDVWIPDYFNGRPLIPLDVMVRPDKPGVKLTIWDWIKFIWIIIPNVPAFISNRPSVSDKRVESLIHLLRETKKYQKIGAVGYVLTSCIPSASHSSHRSSSYCFGGAACVRLGGTNLVDSVAIVHPGNFTLDQVKAIKVPAAWVCAEDDMWFSNSLRLQCEAEFAARKGKENFVEYEFKEYKGTTHGFASRPNLTIPEAREGHKAALDQTVGWFKKTLV
ncbi:hypothetical protein CVT25_002826 [Psilocybe cyanescens]|uniref:Dienelactone hydrolase domain-containing protein n=1 Tax=Psilocybe cyanescens TaxID=93625 RepID=A0A409W0D3_PSICY|nr:hypothetical protein CVT25_002826 [Psilocybe cyanescens]